MAFSNEWELSYSNNTHLSIWPWSDLVSLFSRSVKQNKNQVYPELKVLELGVGAGANIPFFKKMGLQYFGIEGSETIVSELKKNNPEISDNIILGDFTKDWEIENDIQFDYIIDRASITHNTTSDISKVLEQAKNKLKTGGSIIGIDWFSTKHYCYNLGIKCEDEYTKVANVGYFAGLGNVHFSDLEHMNFLFKDFDIQHLSEKVINTFEPKSSNNEKIATWNIVAVKK